MIVVFTYFYTAVQFNPVDQADNLRKYGGYIPGIRPGPPTAQYLDRVLTRLTLPGSLFLAAVAVAPSLFIRYGGFSQASARRARRHLGADRRRRRARHHAPDGVADDDALLRGLPQVGARIALARSDTDRSVNLLILGPQGVRQGNAGEADRRPITAPARRDGRHVPRRDRRRAPSSAAGSRPILDARRARARRAHGRADPRAARAADAQPGSCSTASRERSRRPRRSTRCSHEIGRPLDAVLLFEVSRRARDASASRRARRGGPRRRLARGDRDAARDSTTSRPSRVVEHYRRAGNAVPLHAERSIDDVFAEIEDALALVGARRMIIRKGAARDRADRRAGALVAETIAHVGERLEPGITTERARRVADAFIRRSRRRPDLRGLQGLPEGDLHLAERRRRARHPRRVRRRRRRPRHDRRRRDARRLHRRQRVHVRRRRDRRRRPSACSTSARTRSPRDRARRVVGNRVGDISHAIQEVVEEAGFSVIRSLVGHGVGRHYHEDPHIPNFGEPGRGPRLSEGMTIAIEPMITAGSPDVWLAWTTAGRSRPRTARCRPTSSTRSRSLPTARGSSRPASESRAART